jgi:hypothetical protein
MQARRFVGLAKSKKNERLLKSINESSIKKSHAESYRWLFFADLYRRQTNNLRDVASLKHRIY